MHYFARFRSQYSRFYIFHNLDIPPKELEISYKEKFYINQFPYEACVVNKKNLAHTIQSVFGDTKFLMRTYDLETQLQQFLGDFYRRDEEG